jgi:hypothetical protein
MHDGTFRILMLQHALFCHDRMVANQRLSERVRAGRSLACVPHLSGMHVVDFRQGLAAYSQAFHLVTVVFSC